MKKLILISALALVLLLVPSIALAADIPLTSGGDINAALASASAGDTIILGNGTYELNSQLVIDKDITIMGLSDPEDTIIHVNHSTGYNQGAIQVAVGNTLTISNLTLDGAGSTVFTGIHSEGNVIATDVIVKNIAYSSQYLGFGFRLMAGVNTITNVEMGQIQRVGCYVGASTTAINNFTYHGKGDGDWLDYGIEVERGGVATINTIFIEDCTGVALSDGSGSAGMLATTFFNPGTTVILTNATFSNNSIDLYIGYLSDDTTSFTVTNSTFELGNAIYVSNPLNVVNAQGNNWGTNDLAAIMADLGNPNILIDPIVVPTNPRTGDSTQANGLAIAMLSMLCFVAVGLVVRKKVKN